MKYIPNNKKRCQTELYKLMRCTSELNKSRIERGLPKRSLIEVAQQVIDLDYGDTKTLTYMLSNNMIPDIEYIEIDELSKDYIYTEEELENYRKEIENEKENDSSRED